MLSRSIKTILYLLPVLSIFYKIYLALSTIFISLLSMTNLYINKYNKAIFMRKKMVNYILWIVNIEEADSKLVANIIINLVIYFRSHPIRFFIVKNILYMAKTVAYLLINCNIKSKIT